MLYKFTFLWSTNIPRPEYFVHSERWREKTKSNFDKVLNDSWNLFSWSLDINLKKCKQEIQSVLTKLLQKEFFGGNEKEVFQVDLRCHDGWDLIPDLFLIKLSSYLLANADILWHCCEDDLFLGWANRFVGSKISCIGHDTYVIHFWVAHLRCW